MSQQDSRVQTEGEYWPNPFSRGNLHGPNHALWRGDPEHGGADMEAETAELVRRANLLPTVEAQLESERQLKAEVVELLRTLSIDPESDGITRIRAFLAKVDAP